VQLIHIVEILCNICPHFPVAVVIRLHRAMGYATLEDVSGK
jgi:hypothetical protein